MSNQQTDIEQTTIATVEKLYSYHVFMFPFKWKNRERKGQLIEKQTELAPLAAQIEQSDKNWKSHTSYKTNTLIKYNEYNYFYDFVRKVLYDESDAGGTMMRHYQYEALEGGSYFIELHNKIYELKIDSILLHIYDTGVGVLSFHLLNEKKEQSAPRDILKINQFGRRVYPPFFKIKHEKIGTQASFDERNFTKGLNGHFELAKNIWLAKDGATYGSKENFDTYKNAENFAGNPFQLPKHFQSVLPDVFTTSATNKEDKPFFISPVLDDRMFVVSWYGNDALAEICKQPLVNDDSEYTYLNNEFWYKYIFSDVGSPSCPHKGLRKKYLENSTNGRWAPEGTFYGISGYSFVCLSKQLSTLGKFNFILSHVQTMYYKLVELTLVQRATLLRFSDEVTAISSLDESKKDLTARVSSLYKQYIRFVNKIYFREVTAQEQGIELYELLQKSMKIDRDVKDLDGEMQELHDYASLHEEKRRNDRLELLTLLAAIFIIPSFLTSYYGMNIFNDSLEPYDTDAFKKIFGYVVCASLFCVSSIFLVMRNRTSWRSIKGVQDAITRKTVSKILGILLGIIGIITIVCAMLFPFGNERKLKKETLETQITIPHTITGSIDTSKNTITIPLNDLIIQQKGTIHEEK